MTPPLAEEATRNPQASSPHAAVLSCPAYTILRKRVDFLLAAKAARRSTPGFLLQARERKDGIPQIRLGFTCSKKIGNAVTRNRAKRRLREIARSVIPGLAMPGWDYVLVGRPGVTITRDFRDLEADLEAALRHIHGNRRPDSAGP